MQRCLIRNGLQVYLSTILNLYERRIISYEDFSIQIESFTITRVTGMTQNMSRVGKCIVNKLMEKFRGMIKRERYYGKRFTRRTSLVNMMESYIKHYNNKRLQRHLGVLNPMEKHEQYMLST